MAEYFIFPFQFKDLKESSTDNRYWVILLFKLKDKLHIFNLKVETEDTVSNRDEKLVMRTLNELESALHDDLSLI